MYLKSINRWFNPKTNESHTYYGYTTTNDRADVICELKGNNLIQLNLSPIEIAMMFIGMAKSGYQMEKIM